jgi:hypothetical protein
MEVVVVVVVVVVPGRIIGCLIFNNFVTLVDIDIVLKLNINTYSNCS